MLAATVLERWIKIAELRGIRFEFDFAEKDQIPHIGKATLKSKLNWSCYEM